jgi:hypothetical protein
VGFAPTGKRRLVTAHAMNGLLAEANRAGGEGDYSQLMCYNSDKGYLSPEP